MPTQNIQTPGRGSEENRDPISGEPGAHPVGTGVGAASAGAAGAAIGSVAGPIGTAVGAVIGAVVGGYAGKGIAEAIDPTAEDAYWRENHSQQPYADQVRSYDDYLPAYRAGYTGYRHGETFEAREADLRMRYESGPEDRDLDTRKVGHDANTLPAQEDRSGGNPLKWDDARAAARAAYDRVSRGGSRRVDA